MEIWDPQHSECLSVSPRSSCCVLWGAVIICLLSTVVSMPSEWRVGVLLSLLSTRNGGEYAPSEEGWGTVNYHLLTQHSGECGLRREG